MEFLSQTLINTTTQIVVNSNTITSSYILDPDVTRQYVSSGFAGDTSTTTLKINFDSTQTVDRIALMSFNGEKFNLYYNGATANLFTITNPTTSTAFISNAASDIYLACTPVACTSVSLDIYSTQTANSEKALGYLYIGANVLTFPRIPSADNYKPIKDPKEIVHELSDGGSRRQVVMTKWSTKIKFKYITESFRNSLLAVYETFAPKVYVPFGTGTSWDGILFEANWVDNFDFYTYSDDATSTGFTGSINLKET